MNSYYSNLIEGQSTHPANIERALRHDFASQSRVARLQRIALAHIEAERELEALAGEGSLPLLSAFLQQCHAALYRRLGAEDRTTDDGVVVVPGELADNACADWLAHRADPGCSADIPRPHGRGVRGSMPP